MTSFATTESLIAIRAQPFFDGLEFGDTLSGYYVMALVPQISSSKQRAKVNIYIRVSGYSQKRVCIDVLELSSPVSSSFFEFRWTIFVTSSRRKHPWGTKGVELFEVEVWAMIAAFGHRVRA